MVKQFETNFVFFKTKIRLLDWLLQILMLQNEKTFFRRIAKRMYTKFVYLNKASTSKHISNILQQHKELEYF